MLARYKTDPLDLLAEASRLLASSLDLSSTLPKLANLCIRTLGDYCVIYASLGESGMTLVEAAPQAGVQIRSANPAVVQALLLEQGFESVASAPLEGRNVDGIFAIANKNPDAFSAATQKLISILAVQVASALDQAILFERTHRVADRLQRALLPADFPPLTEPPFTPPTGPQATRPRSEAIGTTRSRSPTGG